MKKTATDKILLTIIIPCRNEEKFIASCLETILAQTFCKDDLEVLIIDGMSKDKTREIIKEYQKKFPFIRLLDNPKGYTPFALNIGIKEARGSIILRLDAHAGYKNDYAEKCVEYLQKYQADNVGGICKILPKDNSLQARAIALTLSSFFGAGNAYYRRGYDKGIKSVDTVFCGCFRKKTFDSIGMFDEKMIRNQDFEFNSRLIRSGGKILLCPDIVSYYYPKSDLRAFAKHNFKDGFWVVYPLKYGIKAFSWRHLLPMVFAAGLIGLVFAGIFYHPFLIILAAASVFYFLLNLYFSVIIAIKEKNLPILFFTMAAFFTRQFFYGLGSLWGFINIFLKK